MNACMYEWMCIYMLYVYLYMGGCQNCGPLLGPLNIRCRIILRSQKRDHSFDNHPYVRVNVHTHMCICSFDMYLYMYMFMYVYMYVCV